MLDLCRKIASAPMTAKAMTVTVPTRRYQGAVTGSAARRRASALRGSAAAATMLASDT